MSSQQKLLTNKLTYLIIFPFTVIMTSTSQRNPNEAKGSKKANRPSTYKKRPPGLDSYTCNMALNIVARKVESVKANNGGVAPYGTVSAIVREMKPFLPWLNKEMLRSHMKKLNKQQKQSKQQAEFATASLTAGVVGVGTNTHNGDSSHSTLTVDTTFPVDDSTIHKTVNTTSSSTSILGRHPAGSATSNKQECNTCLQLATSEAARVYKIKMDEGPSNNDTMSRLSKGELTRIIDNVKAKYAKYKVPSCTTISELTICSRKKRNNVNPATAQGTQSPMGGSS